MATSAGDPLLLTNTATNGYVNVPAIGGFGYGSGTTIINPNVSTPYTLNPNWQTTTSFTLTGTFCGRCSKDSCDCFTKEELKNFKALQYVLCSSGGITKAPVHKIGVSLSGKFIFFDHDKREYLAHDLLQGDAVVPPCIQAFNAFQKLVATAKELSEASLGQSPFATLPFTFNSQFRSHMQGIIDRVKPPDFSQCFNRKAPSSLKQQLADLIKPYKDMEGLLNETKKALKKAVPPSGSAYDLAKFAKARMIAE